MSLGVIIFNPVSLLILLLFFFLNCNTVVAKYNKGPLPPPHRNSQFFLHPSEIFQRSKVPVNPLGNDFRSPPPPPTLENLVHSGGEWEWIFEWNRPQFIYG